MIKIDIFSQTSICLQQFKNDNDCFCANHYISLQLRIISLLNMNKWREKQRNAKGHKIVVWLRFKNRVISNSTLNITMYKSQVRNNKPKCGVTCFKPFISSLCLPSPTYLSSSTELIGSARSHR